MKHTIEIECPDGYKPIYNAETGNVEIVPENIMEQIKTYEDAAKYLGYAPEDEIPCNKSIEALAKLQTILEVLNEGHKFGLIEGRVWYPWIRFYGMRSIPRNAKIIGHFCYQGVKFALEGGLAQSPEFDAFEGIGYFNSYNGDNVGIAHSKVGMFACKSEEIARYVSTQFGKLIFEACFARHFNGKEFEWVS